MSEYFLHENGKADQMLSAPIRVARRRRAFAHTQRDGHETSVRTRRLNAFDQTLQSDVSELIEHLRTGDVDFAAEAKAAIGGTSSNIAEAAGYVSLLSMSADVDSIPVEVQPSERVQATSPEQAGNGQEQEQRRVFARNQTGH